MEDYLTTKELSERIKYPPGTIRNMVCNGTFKKNVHYVKPTPRKILFMWSAIEQWLHGEPVPQSTDLKNNQNPNTGLINI